MEPAVDTKDWLRIGMKGYRTTAEFTCPICKKPTVTQVAVPAPGRFGDPNSENEGDVEVTCMQCGAEYPGHASVGPLHCNIQLNGRPDVQVAANVPIYLDDEGWDDYEPPENPYSTFIDSLMHIEQLLKDHGGDGSHLVNRLVFAHQVSALEAFLADTVINAVSTDQNLLSTILRASPELAKAKFTLAEVNATDDFVRIKVLSYLRAIVWHRLDVVRELYRSLFDIDLYIVLGPDRKALLFQAIEYRHDCVHRNGYDANKNRLEVFTKEYVTEIGDVIKALGQNVQAQIDFGSPSRDASSRE